MSRLALLKAVRNHLRKALSLSDLDCTIKPPPGMPSANMGQYHIAVCEAAGRTVAKAYRQDDFSIDVVVSLKTGQIPADRMEDIYETHAGQLEQWESKIAAALHGNQNVRIAANTIAKLPHIDRGDIFQTPLFYTGWGPLQTHAADWGMDDAAENVQTFVSQTLSFGGCTRIQALDIQH